MKMQNTSALVPFFFLFLFFSAAWRINEPYSSWYDSMVPLLMLPFEIIHSAVNNVKLFSMWLTRRKCQCNYFVVLHVATPVLFFLILSMSLVYIVLQSCTVLHDRVLNVDWPTQVWGAQPYLPIQKTRFGAYFTHSSVLSDFSGVRILLYIPQH